ncbi:Putative D-alanyl-D-alanine carboxypeptidase [Paenibacillus sp. CECT 9249]|uniref:serine hydrolase domain-containing protein n=1 Tax=Paenibacillus sp. CECT 9249 TaxID=2845385 RepID=UPI001E31BC54|nr:serine hydrolase [Paenibacillus sp. CECT 9249]CAH0120151.1 Putative D-alanyl-D-alanine carboxypeptidase [Paenibacillus sp. CECT 9249]
MNLDLAQARIENHFRNMVRKDPNIVNAYFLVHSDKHGVHWNMAEGATGNLPANAQQPYYIASVTKLFTSVLVAMLEEEGRVSYEDPIDRYIEPELLHRLHVYKGKEYTHEIKIKHLLNHTSGLHDFFLDKPKSGRAMLDLLVDEPSRFWSPQEVVLWAKEHLQTRFPPGKGFHYSDTGYHLLGFMIETVTAMPLHEAYRHYIFQPLGMVHSYMSHHSEPIGRNEYPTAGVYSGTVNVAHYPSASIEYAGGAIVSTSEDLLKFMKSLAKHEIIRKDSFEKMKDWSKFMLGIDYGYGLVAFRTVPVLMPQKYNVWGNFGYSGSFSFYHPALDSYFIGSLNQFRYTRKGIRLMGKAIDTLLKM